MTQKLIQEIQFEQRWGGLKKNIGWRKDSLMVIKDLQMTIDITLRKLLYTPQFQDMKCNTVLKKISAELEALPPPC